MAEDPRRPSTPRARLDAAKAMDQAVAAGPLFEGPVQLATAGGGAEAQVTVLHDAAAGQLVLTVAGVGEGTCEVRADAPPEASPEELALMARAYAAGLRVETLRKRKGGAAAPAVALGALSSEDLADVLQLRVANMCGEVRELMRRKRELQERVAVLESSS